MSNVTLLLQPGHVMIKFFEIFSLSLDQINVFSSFPPLEFCLVIISPHIGHY